MKVKRKQQNKNIQNIKNLISFNNIKNPFKNSNESEKFFKNIIEEEMNLSNNYNSENLNRLLDLYFKGLNMYQNTPNIDMINAFTEKSQILLQSSKVKKILNQNKIKTSEINEIKTDSTLIDENEESECSNKNKIINPEKEMTEYKNLYNTEEEDDEDEENIYDNKLKYDFKRNNTIRLNEIQNRNKLNDLNNSIKKGIKEKNNQKQKINELNKEFNKIKEQQLRTSIFLEDEIKKQSNNFKKKLIKKKTMLYKSKNLKLNIDVIKEENIKEDKDNNSKIKNNENQDKKNNQENKEIKIYNIPKKSRNKTPNNPKIDYNMIFTKIKDKKNLKRNSFSFFTKNDKNNNKVNDEKNNNMIKNQNNDNNNNNIIKNLKTKINKYIEEYNDDIYKYYFSSTINKISDLANKNFSSNINIYEGYQTNIKDLLKKQMSCNNAEEEQILEDDINTLREEQDHEIDKNNDLYEKLFEEEISKFKLLGYPNSSLKELDILKNKIKCDLYNEIYNILNK